MTSIWTDDTDMESAEYDDSEAEGLFGDSDVDSEDYDAESRATDARRRRARARRVALARRRQATARARTPARRQPSAVGKSPQSATAAAVRTLDLETKVQEDTFRNAIAAQNRRASRGEYAAVAGAAVNQFIETFKAPENVYAKAALRFSPLLLLAPQSKGRGVEGLIKDPRVIGGAAVAGLVVAGEFRNRSNEPRDIEILGPKTPLALKQSIKVVAKVLDSHGVALPKQKVTWSSDQTSTAATVAQIDDTSATLTANSAGMSMITATCGNVVGYLYVTVG
jgi:hypothetical protein